MTIYETIVNAYPELEENHRVFQTEIIIQNDSDGTADFIAKWNYSKPIPDGLKVGKLAQPK
jgi:hypothetical protein